MPPSSWSIKTKSGSNSTRRKRSTRAGKGFRPRRRVKGRHTYQLGLYVAAAHPGHETQHLKENNRSRGTDGEHFGRSWRGRWRRSWQGNGRFDSDLWTLALRVKGPLPCVDWQLGSTVMAADGSGCAAPVSKQLLWWHASQRGIVYGLGLAEKDIMSWSREAKWCRGGDDRSTFELYGKTIATNHCIRLNSYEDIRMCPSMMMIRKKPPHNIDGFVSQQERETWMD